MSKIRPLYAFNQFIDLKNIKDSMQLDSGQVIATLQTPEGFLSLEVKGEVRVFWDADGLDAGFGVYGECYRHPSLFDNELKKLIETKEDWENDKRVYVIDNNWFEVFYGIDDEDLAPISDVVDVEGLSSKELESMMLDTLTTYYLSEDTKKRKEKASKKLREFTIPVEWSLAENIKVEATSLEEAIEWVREHEDEIPCGDGEYIDGSWKITPDQGQSAKELASLIRSWGGVFDDRR